MVLRLHETNCSSVPRTAISTASVARSVYQELALNEFVPAMGCEQPQCATKNADDPKSKKSHALDTLLPHDAIGCDERRRRDSNPGWRICNPMQTLMALRMTCDSLQTPGLRVQQTPRKHGQSRGEVTLWVTPGR